MIREIIQGIAQLEGILIDRADATGIEQAWEEVLHQMSIFQHITDAGGTSQVVFEHVNLTIRMPDQVRPGDMNPYISRGIHAHALFSKSLGCQQDVFRDSVGFQNLLVVIEIVYKEIQGFDALFEAAFHLCPFGG